MDRGAAIDRCTFTLVWCIHAKLRRYGRAGQTLRRGVRVEPAAIGPGKRAPEVDGVAASIGENLSRKPGKVAINAGQRGLLAPEDPELPLQKFAVDGCKLFAAAAVPTGPHRGNLGRTSGRARPIEFNGTFEPLAGQPRQTRHALHKEMVATAPQVPILMDLAD